MGEDRSEANGSSRDRSARSRPDAAEPAGSLPPRGPARAPLRAVVGYGLLSVALYALLFTNEDRILEWLTRGGWYALIPIGAALIFSFVHGSFTARFWSALGIHERQRERPGR